MIALISLAHEYEYFDLEKSISDYLESILDTKNVCKIYDRSNMYQLKSLEEACTQFIDRNCQVLIKQNTFMEFSCDSLAVIISRDSFYASETDIFKIVKDWHEYNGVKKPELKLTEHIRLPLMEIKFMLNQVRNSKLISSDKILDAIKQKTESNDMSLRHRGILIPNENIFTGKYKAIVINGKYEETLFGDGDNLNHDSYVIQSSNSIDDNQISLYWVQRNMFKTMRVN